MWFGCQVWRLKKVDSSRVDEVCLKASPLRPPSPLAPLVKFDPVPQAVKENFKKYASGYGGLNEKVYSKKILQP